jgi:hypothetical protein
MSPLTASRAADAPALAGPVDASWRMARRRVRRGWVAAGVLLIVLSALGSAALIRALGPAEEFLAVANEVPAGARVSASDLMVVRLSATPGLATVPAAEADQVVGRYAVVTLTPGSLVSPAQLTTQRVPGPGEQLVAIQLSRNDLPGGVLRSGDPVLLVATRGQGSSGDAPRTFEAVVHEVRAAEGRGSGVVVSLLVPDRDGPVVAGLAAAGRVAVVRVTEPTR